VPESSRSDPQRPCRGSATPHAQIAQGATSSQQRAGAAIPQAATSAGTPSLRRYASNAPEREQLSRDLILNLVPRNPAIGKPVLSRRIQLGEFPSFLKQYKSRSDFEAERKKISSDPDNYYNSVTGRLKSR
jgi:hypothetical protein